ncbi:MAG: flagellar basal body L-ring protein FlgH [Verrucomicrobiota bacterium]
MPTNLKTLFLMILGFSCLVPSWAQNGSLYDTRGSAIPFLFADRTACQVGDLVTISVVLSTQTQLNEQIKSSKKNSLQDAISNLFYNTQDGMGQFYRYRNLPPSFQWGGSRDHEGDGSINNKETLTTTIQARVTDMLPNNTLRILGSRTFTTSEETVHLTVTGLVRRDDLSRDNLVASTKIADLQIKQAGEGSLSRDQQKGFLTKVYESINPF